MATPSNPDLDRVSSEMYKTWEKAMGAWWDEVLESPAFLGTVNKNLKHSADARGATTQAMDAWMTQMHLPTRDDIVRVARIASLLEDRLLAQEDLLLEMKDRLVAAEKEAVKARIEAAETRIALEDRLASVDAALRSLGTPGAPPAPVRRNAAKKS